MKPVHQVRVAIRGLVERAVQSKWPYILGLSFSLLTLAFAVHLDGQPHAHWLQFLGRFHPLLVHLPIGLLVLVPILEIAGKERPTLRETASFVLHLTVIAAGIALLCGLILAYGSGVTGATITRHLWGGIVFFIELLAWVILRPAWLSGELQRVYPAMVGVTLLTLTWTAHQGGSLTHGSDFLTRYMPAPLLRLFPSQASDSAYAGSAYMRNIHPIFDAKCVACHGARKEQAGLRLDFYELLMKGGRDGAVIVARHPDRSLLLQRVTLHPSDGHFMPAEGRTPLTADEIAILRAWILSGASPTDTDIPGISSTKTADLPLRPVGDYSYLMNDIRQMQNAQGAKLVAVSAQPSDGLILRTIDVGSQFDDAQLARFARFAPFIVEAELARTAVTDACFDTLSKFSNLRRLHLEGTAVSGRALSKLSSLSQLTYLNLSGTKVSKESLDPLKGMPNLHLVYLFETPAEPASTSTNNNLRSTQ